MYLNSGTNFLNRTLESCPCFAVQVYSLYIRLPVYNKVMPERFHRIGRARHLSVNALPWRSDHVAIAPFIGYCFRAARWCNVVQHTNRGSFPCLDQDASRRNVLPGRPLHSRLIFTRHLKIWPRKRRFRSPGLSVTQPKNTSPSSGRCLRGQKMARNSQVAAGRFYEFFAGAGMVTRSWRPL